jgi:uncharacterized protein YndB with AHSA1/START domain
MSQQELHFQETIRAPIDRVFEFLADHQNFASLFGGSCRVVRAGKSEPNGRGSVRRVGSGLLSFDEQIVTFERPQRIEYKIVRGGPIKDHLGTIVLKEVREVDDAGARSEQTAIDYTIRFKGKLPLLGPLTARLLQFGWRRSARKSLSKIEH